MAMFVAFAGVAPLRAENLADAMVSAYNTSGLLEQNRAVLRAADEDVAIAVSTLRPVLDFVLRAQRLYNGTGADGFPRSTTNSSSATAQFSAEWLLWDNGARQSSVAAAKETVLATRESLVSIEQSVLFRATSAYLNVLLQGQNVGLQRNNLRVLGEELRAAQDRFDVGEVTRTDVALAQSRVAAARSNVTTAIGSLHNAEAEYTSAVGHPPRNLAGEPRLPADPKSLEAAIAVAVRTHPDIMAAQHQVSATEFTLQRVSQSLGPSLTANATVGITDSLDTSGYSQDASLGLTLSQRIYQGGGLAAQVRRAMASRDSARGNLLTVQRNVVQDVNNAFTRLEVARSSLTATAEQVRAAQVAFDGIREEATLGARTTLDVLSAEQDLLNARTSQISARSERSVAAFQLLAAQGLLTAEKLRLGVQIYDPTVYYNLTKNAPSKLSKQSKDLDRVLKALGKQ